MMFSSLLRTRARSTPLAVSRWAVLGYYSDLCGGTVQSWHDVPQMYNTGGKPPFTQTKALLPERTDTYTRSCGNQRVVK